MDKYYPKNIDPRPHRRHNKDNPYTIFTVGINTDTPHYYVSFKDGQGVRICMEIEKSIYELLDKFEIEDLSYLNEVDRHYEHSELISEGGKLSVIGDAVGFHLRCVFV